LTSVWVVCIFFPIGIKVTLVVTRKNIWWTNDCIFSLRQGVLST